MTTFDMKALSNQRPETIIYYKPIEAGPYADPEGPLDDKGRAMCTTGECRKLAINYSGKCIDHGGKHGPDAMSRLEKFRNGFIGVKDLDYEELRDGVTRDPRNALRKRASGHVTQMPETLYREMVQELYTQHDERMRGLLDKSLKNVEDVLDAEFQTTIKDKDGNMITSGVTANEKLNAAKFVWQTVRGKMPENVQVTVDSKPFEKVFQGIARGISRERARVVSSEGVIEGEIIDAEVVSNEQAKGQGPQGHSEPVDGRSNERRNGNDPGVADNPDGGTVTGDNGDVQRSAKRTCPDVPEAPLAGPDVTQRAEEARVKAERIAERRERIRASKSLKEQGVDTNVIHNLMAPPEPDAEAEVKIWQWGDGLR